MVLRSFANAFEKCSCSLPLCCPQPWRLSRPRAGHRHRFGYGYHPGPHRRCHPGSHHPGHQRRQRNHCDRDRERLRRLHFQQSPRRHLQAGHHQPGFSQVNLDNVIVSTGQTNGLGIEKLNTGGAVETIQVSTGEALLETTQAQVSRVFDSEAIENLPTGGGLDKLALLVPGVVGNRGGSNFSNTNGVGISSNGQRGRSNNFEIDGQSNNDNSVAGSQVFFQNQDAVAEIQIITNNFSAEYGRNMGSVVNYITKSGTNSIHGSGFEYYTGNFLSAATQSQKSQYISFKPLRSRVHDCSRELHPGQDSTLLGQHLRRHTRISHSP